MQADANRVLIIEDEDDLANLMRSVLEDEGYTVLVHSTGDCIKVIRAFQPDLVITDYMLPLYDGHVVLERIRREVASDLPIILISAMPRPGSQWEEWGADDFLAKPFDLDTLLMAVERASDRASSNYAKIFSGYDEQEA